MNSTSELPEELLQLVKRIHQEQKKLVFVSGVFDLFHQEHQKFLEKASQHGEYLIVGIESDVRVRKLKGEGRPSWPQEKRKQAVESFPVVSMAFVLPEEFSKPSDHELLIRTLRPHVLAVSSHSPHLPEKQKIMDLVNGKVVVVHDHNPQISTTQILKASQ